MLDNVWFDGGCYEVERVFNGEQTVNDIVSRKLMAQKGNVDLLTYAQPVMYNEPGGSVRL